MVHMPLIPVQGRQIPESEASLAYRMSSMVARATQEKRDPPIYKYFSHEDTHTHMHVCLHAQYMLKPFSLRLETGKSRKIG